MFLLFEFISFLLQFVGVVESSFATARGGHFVSLSADLPPLLLFGGEVLGRLGGSPAAHVASLRRRQARAAAAVAAG